MKKEINPLATVELIAPLVQQLIDNFDDDNLKDGYHGILCTLHQLVFPSRWNPPFTNCDAVESAIRVSKAA